LWGRNLTDVEQLTRSLYLPLGPSNIMLRSPMIGRTYGLELRFNF
jgi:outer membrane receptor protein involved in Fe transport